LYFVAISVDRNVNAVEPTRLHRGLRAEMPILASSSAFRARESFLAKAADKILDIRGPSQDQRRLAISSKL
jgi:hypothetical protein